MKLRRRVLGSFVAFLALAVLLGSAPASAVDWSVYTDQGVVEIVTHNEEGAPRATKIWIVVLDGEAYVRTGNTTWGRNAERDPEVRILIAEAGYDLRVEFVADEATRARIVQAFRDKYGWSDRLISPFRGRSSKIMHLLPRDGGE